MADETDYVYSDDDDAGGGQAAAPSPRRDAATGGGPPGAVSTLAALRGASTIGSAALFGNLDYRVLREAEIKGEQARLGNEVAEMLDIPPECANTLLIHNAWDKEKLFETYYADPVGQREAAGIKTLGTSSRATAPFTCSICLEDRPAAQGFALGCKHLFCSVCWGGFLEAATVDNGANCISSRCPEGPSCGESVTWPVVLAMASPEVAARWSLYELKHFVAVSKAMAWCPAPGCTHAFVARAPVRDAVCACGQAFCFKCAKEAHAPVSCAKLEAWLAKCGNESETANWILAHTKKCPQCSARIEKNQGCNHIKCSNKGCRFEFCWTCLGPWAEHGQSTGGFYACNKYRGRGGGGEEGVGAAGGGGSKRSSEAQAKAELERYLFYYQRYANHEAAGRFAAKHRELTQQRMADLALTQGASSSWAEAAFLESATEALLACRRTLKYTYALGYFMREGGEKALFEHLQEQLERSTEHLAELTEAPLEKMERGEVVNFTRVTTQFLKNLLEGLDEGLIR